VTSEARKRAPFELLAFTAAPAAGALVVIELEGRFAASAQNGRFIRRPVLVVEAADDRPRLELAPVRAELRDAYWRGAYAIPAEALTGASFALGLRGTLLELPPPDESDTTDRLTALAREANSLRRALEAAEAETGHARAEADATSAELGAAVLAARDSALAESADRITVLEVELAEARRTAAEQIVSARDEALAAHEQVLTEVTARADAAEQRATDAEARAQGAEKAARAAESGTNVLRAELAEERGRPRTAVTEPAAIAPVPPQSTPPHTTTPRGPGPWIAVGALVLFAFALLILLLG
jgi:hypothetical protein